MKQIILILFMISGARALSFAGDLNRETTPSIILIMADDLGYGDLGCYGQQKILTPHIDGLAAEGMRFTQAYAGSTVCTPSRCSLMTGLHNGHNRIRDNLPPEIFLQPDDFTIAELIKQAGYHTGGIGKWGLGTSGSWGTPNMQGFDYWYGHLNTNQAHFYYPDYLWENDRVVLLEELTMVDGVGLLSGNRGGSNKLYTHDLFTEKALSFIESNQSNPFFLYLAYTIPHYSDYPEDTPEHFMVPSDHPYSRKPWSQQAKNYAAMITRMDRDVGRIIELIRNLGLEENTVIIFTSDNGPYQGVPTPVEFFNSNGPFRGGKRDLYEGGIRIPFIVRWKNTVPASAIYKEPVTFWDILPTFADMIGYPDDIHTDGVSITPFFSHELDPPQRDLYWDYGHTRDTYLQAVRQGDFKGIQFFHQGKQKFELYNLKDDPAESRDISANYQGIVQEMQDIMKNSYTYSEAYDISKHLK